MRSAASVAGRALDRRPTPPTSTTAPSGASAATRPDDEGDHERAAVAVASADGDPGLGAAAPDVADRQAEGVGGVRRRGAAVSRRILVTMAPTWALSARPLPVTAAFISLGVCRATGIPAGPRRDRHRAGLGGAHHRADVVLAEDALHGHHVGAVLDAARPRRRRSMASSRAPMSSPAGVRTTSTATSVAAGRRRPRRHPDRSESAPGRRRARAPSYLLVQWAAGPPGPPSEHLFGTKLPAPSPTTRHRRARHATSLASTT